MIHHLSPAEWRLLAPAMAGHSYRQLLSFGVVTAARLRAKVETVGVFDGERCAGVASVRIKKLPFGSGGVAYISGGPLIPGDSSREDLRLTLQALAKEYVDRRKLVLRIMAPVEWAVGGWQCEDVFTSLGFRVADGIRPYRTILIDLSGDEAELRARLHPKWRNCLASAEREGLSVRVSTDDEDLARFGRLHQDLMSRKGFDVELDVDVYRRVQRMSSAGDRLEVRLVEQDGVPLAGHVSSALGESKVYLFGASTPEGNRRKASYLLQWDALLAARSRGMKWYDLGGIDPDENEGVYRFKARMSGIDVSAPGPFELQPNGARASITRFAERGYRAVRRRRRRR
jgi:lipid II:glycine glycyltransferase (peptidoglycan interpeptide bridge formation enzyme)